MNMIQLETGVCVRLSKICVIQALRNKHPYRGRDGKSYAAVLIVETPRSTWRIPQISLERAELYRDQLRAMVNASGEAELRRAEGDSGFEEIDDEARTPRLRAVPRP